MKSIADNLNLSLLETTAVLFPGSAILLLANQIQVVQKFLLGILPSLESEWQVGLAFLGTAYFCGYILFFLGSLLDRPVYDNCKHFFFKKEIMTDKEGNTLKDNCNNEIKVRPRESNETSLFKKASKIKKKHLKGTDYMGNDINR
jgi:hypothetical protein